MITDPRLLYGTTLAQQVPGGPLSPQSLVQQGTAGGVLPTGEVTTKYEPTTEYKVPSAQTKSAMGEVDEASDDEIEAQRDQTAAKVKIEQMEAGSLAAQANIAKQKQEALDAQQKKRDEWFAKVETERAAQLEDFKKTSSSKTLFEDMTPVRRFLSALAVGAGQWAATMSGSGRNGAYEIFKDQEENWRKAKENELKSQVERMAATGKSVDQMTKFFADQNDLIEKRFAARHSYALSAAKSLQATVPQVGAKAAETIAKMEKDDAINKRNFSTNFDKTVREPGTSTQTSSGDKSGAGVAANRKTESEQKLAMLGSSMKAELNAITKGPALTEKDLQGLQDDTLGSAAADKKAESSPFSAFVVGLGRWADMIPRNRYDSLSKEKKIVVNAWDNAVEKYARILTGAGMPAEEARRMGLQNMPVAGDDAGTQKFKFDRLAREADFMMSLSNDAKAAIVKRLQEGETFDSLIPAQEAPQTAPQPTGKVGSPVKVKAIPPKIQDAAVAAVDDYSAIKAAMKAGKVKQTPNLMEAMGRLVRSHQAGGNDEAAAKYLRMLREREGI